MFVVFKKSIIVLCKYLLFIIPYLVSKNSDSWLQKFRDISKILGVNEISDEEIGRIRSETTLDKLREQLKMGNISYYPSKRDDNWKLFREGKVGSWRKYFKASHVRDILRIQNGNFSLLSKIVYALMFTLRRIVFRIE